MNNGGDAAEQIVRLSLEGFEVAAKLTGSAAKNIAVLLASTLKQEVNQTHKTKGKARLTNMLKSGKELKVFALQNKDIPKFTEQAKRYGVLYCVLRDKTNSDPNAPVDIIARAEDASKIQRISDRFELGKVDIGRHHGFYEGSFDLMQNPTTFDIEAFATLRDITAETVSRDIVNTLYRVDYETIAVIDAETGEALPFRGTHITEVIAEQKRTGDNVAGVRSYLQKFCTDDDIDRVILETSLPYVKEQLKDRRSHTVSYSLLQNGRKIHKRTLFAYLDESKKTILCTMQDISRTFNTEQIQRDRLCEAVKTLQEISGVDVARYDLQTRRFFSSCGITFKIGYDEVIDNVPDTFINNGNVAPESIKDFREFFEKLRRGEAATMNAHLQIESGAFHLFRAHGSIVNRENREPHQAIIAFQDIDKMREQAPAYRKLKQSIAEKGTESYKLYRCNLSQGTALEKVEGDLESPYKASEFSSLAVRAQNYSEQYLHPDDKEAYLELMNTENLLTAYDHGAREMTMEYREKTEKANGWRWMRIQLEMAQYPDCTDIELLLLIQTA